MATEVSSSETLTSVSTVTTLMPEDDPECYEELLTEEEVADLSKTLEILALAQARCENEDLQRQEEQDMKATMDMISEHLSETEARLLKGDLKSSTGKYVHFSHSVKVHVLPTSERIDARNSRKRFWGAGPEHDELWDGETGTFREVELTPEELASMMKRRSKVATRIKSYFMGKEVKIDAQSHAKLISDDIEEEDTAQPMQKRTSLARLLSFVRGKSNTSRRPSKEEVIVEELREGSIEMENDWIEKVLQDSVTYVDEGDI